MTVEEAIAEIRRQAGNVETIYYAYVLDSEQHLLGVVSFRDLFTCERRCVVRDIMLTDYLSVSEDIDQESVARVFAEQSLLAIPVLDAERRMKGIVTVDDIVDVVTEEASEDIQKIGGMQALDAPYMEIGFWSMIRKRGGWLAVLFLGEMLTATAMGRYEEEISRAVVLAVFVPLIISSGGNSGSSHHADGARDGGWGGSAEGLVAGGTARNRRRWAGRDPWRASGLSRILVWQPSRGTSARTSW